MHVGSSNLHSSTMPVIANNKMSTVFKCKIRYIGEFDCSIYFKCLNSIGTADVAQLDYSFRVINVCVGISNLQLTYVGL